MEDDGRCLFQSTVATVAWKDWQNSTRTLRITGNPSKIRTGYFLNTKCRRALTEHYLGLQDVTEKDVGESTTKIASN